MLQINFSFDVFLFFILSFLFCYIFLPTKKPRTLKISYTYFISLIKQNNCKSFGYFLFILQKSMNIRKLRIIFPNTNRTKVFKITSKLFLIFMNKHLS